MHIAIVALTPRGLTTAKKLVGQYPDPVDVYAPADTIGQVGQESASWPVRALEGSLTSFCAHLWSGYRGLVFIMAAGIVVRCLAPYLEHKHKDPAVVVLDEEGRYAISLLGGHLGGANDLARRIAAILGGTPVITTASDVQGLPALDVVARELSCRPVPERRMTKVMAAMVKGKRVGFWAEEPWRERLLQKMPGLEIHPLEDFRPEDAEAGVLVTSRRVPLPPGPWLFWRPRELVAGIGCRRGADRQAILAALGQALKAAGRSRWSLRALATVELKAREEGLLAAARQLGIPLLTFKKEVLARALREQPQLSHSSVVEGKIGIGGVCEPAAWLAAKGGELLCRKMSYQGVTVALAREAWPS
ncbi:cobalt-precorrin 5A hydrolase [Moorellaceae bacterium AZ2]